VSGERVRKSTRVYIVNYDCCCARLQSTNFCPSDAAPRRTVRTANARVRLPVSNDEAADGLPCALFKTTYSERTFMRVVTTRVPTPSRSRNPAWDAQVVPSIGV